MEIGAWEVASVVTKTVMYAATLSAAGGAAFVLQHRSAMSPALHHRVRHWLGACAGVAVFATTVRVGVLAGSMGGAVATAFDRTMVRMVLEAGEGRAAVIRIVGLLAIGAWLAVPRPSAALALAGALAAATSFAWVGHAWAASDGYGPVVLLSLHLACIALWLGALVPLYMATREEALARVAGLTHAFGRTAQYVVAVLIASGALALVILLRTPSELWTTDYGRLFCFKLACVVALLGLAGFNKLRLTPRLLAADRSAVAALRKSVGFEITLAAFILLVTASFTTLVGPASLE